VSTPTNFATLGLLTNATLTIVESLNAPGVINFAATNFFVDEAATNAVITVNRTGGSLGLVSVNYMTQDGAAIAPFDYASVAGVVAFADGETTKTFLVPIVLDTITETNETVNLVLLNPQGGAVLGATNQATLTIVNNDILIYGSLVFSSTNYLVGEAAGSVAVTVQRLGGSSNTVTVFYSTVSGNTPTTNETAATLSDYTPTSGILSWANLDGAPKTILIPVLNNSIVDGARSFEVVLANVTGGASIGSPGRSFVTITNDDFLPGAIGFAQVTFSAVENGTNAVVTVSRTNGNLGVVTVNYATGNGTALAGRDYVATTGLLTLTNGATNATFLVPLIDNAIQDGSRYFRVGLSGFSVGSLPALTNAYVRITDDEGAAGSVDLTYNGGTNGPDAIVYSVGLLGDGRAVIGGDFLTYDGVSRPKVARVGIEKKEVRKTKKKSK